MTIGGFSTTKEAAAELGVTAHTLRQAITGGRLYAVRVGDQYLIPSSEIARYRTESLGQPGRKKVTK